MMNALLPNALSMLTLPHEKKLFIIGIARFVCGSQTLRNDANIALWFVIDSVVV
jgi:hypothetical protein